MVGSMMPPSTSARKTMATRKMPVRWGLMATDMMRAKTRWTGARTHMRVSIWKAFWTLVTSVVMRVTRPAVENLSMLVKE